MGLRHTRENAARARRGTEWAKTARPQFKVRFVGVLMLIIGVLPLIAGGRDFAYAARLAGTQGTFQVFYAERFHGTGRDSQAVHTVWNGTFRSADGRTTDDKATLRDEADSHKLGARIPVTRAGAGTYYTARANYALGWLCLCLAGGWMVAVALVAVSYGRGFRRADPQTPRPVRAALLIARGCVFASGAAGAAAVAVDIIT
ncbi:hypothetical protein ABZ845_21570 [Streptomyces sp. NPDC047022]|uniref:hypothetical protein n=1 Tax=Streptomyces sp. NPDC047022 TaxID=3155737 RepID=UPI0033F2C33A